MSEVIQASKRSLSLEGSKTMRVKKLSWKLLFAVAIGALVAWQMRPVGTLAQDKTTPAAAIALNWCPVDPLIDDEEGNCLYYCFNSIDDTCVPAEFGYLWGNTGIPCPDDCIDGCALLTKAKTEDYKSRVPRLGNPVPRNWKLYKHYPDPVDAGRVPASMRSDGMRVVWSPRATTSSGAKAYHVISNHAVQLKIPGIKDLVPVSMYSVNLRGEISKNPHHPKMPIPVDFGIERLPEDEEPENNIIQIRPEDIVDAHSALVRMGQGRDQVTYFVITKQALR